MGGFLLAAGPATPAAAASGGGCNLVGTASFNNPLTNTAGNFTYSFAGNLQSCQASDSSAPTSGTVEAGKTFTVPYNWTYVDSLGITHSGSAVATYQEPVPRGNGSCATSTTSGESVARWADGTVTVISYSTTGAAAAVTLNGSVVASLTATLSSYTGPTQAPPASTSTIATTRDLGDAAQGALTFQPPDPTACNGAGVSSAAINGISTLDSTA